MTIIAIAGIAGIAIGVALVLAIAIGAASVRDARSSSWEIGSMFVSPGLPDRPHGVQEEDLPRFIFRDEPAAAITQ